MRFEDLVLQNASNIRRIIDEALTVDRLNILDENLNYDNENYIILSVKENGVFNTYKFNPLNLKNSKYINTNPSPVTVGGVNQGQAPTPENGLTVNEMFDKIFSNTINSTVSFNVNNEIIEKGSDYNKNINITFNQNDAGAFISQVIQKDGADIATQQPPNQPTSFTANNVIEDFTLQAFVEHEAGNSISAGTISTPVRTITPKLKIFYGAVASIPTSSVQVRSLGNDVWDNANQAILQTGTINTNFVIAIPTSINNSATLSAQDTTNNVGYEFTFDSETDVALPNGDLEEYRIYKVTVDNAFGASANIVINL